MKKCLMFVIMAVALIFTGSIAGQSTDEYNKGEIFAGYSSDSYVDDPYSYVIARGVKISGVYNIKRYIGIKAEASYTVGKSETVDFVPYWDNPTMGRVKYTNRSVINAVTAGVQVKNNLSDAKFKPFGHLMFGVGHAKEKVTDITCTTVKNCLFIPQSEKPGLAFILGGGLDIKINKKIDIRAVQFDLHYLAQGAGNVGFSSGIIFKF